MIVLRVFERTLLHTDSLDPGSIFGILEAVFELQILIPLVPDVHGWLDITLCNYLPTFGATYRELLLEFLGDPVRAGKYLLDGTKFATLAKILLDYLIRLPDNDDPRR